MSNSIQFALGLSTGQFISGLGEAGSKLAGFMGGVLSVGAIAEKTWAQIEKGAHLEQLSARTGQSVASLVELGAAFKAAGLDSDGVSPMLNRLGQSLGGVDEMGRSTRDAFSAVGTSIEDLKGKSAPQQMMLIAAGLKTLNTESRLFAASRIFGREGGANFVQLTSDTKAFAEALKAAEEKGKTFERIGELFHQVELAVGKLKTKFDAVFLGIAEGVAPAIKAIADLLGKLDLSGVGNAIADFGKAITVSIQEGKIDEYLGLALSAGIETGWNFFSSLFSNESMWDGLVQGGLGAFGLLGAGILKILEIPLVYLQSFLDKIVQEAIKFAHMTELGPILDALGFESDGKTQTFDEILAERKKSGVDLYGSSIDEIQKAATESLKESGKPIADAFSEASKAAKGPLRAEFEKRTAEFAANFVAPKSDNKPGSKDFAGGSAAAGGKGLLSDANSLERVGGIFGYGGFSNIDHGKDTALNTAKTVEKLGQIHAAIRRLGGENEVNV